MKRQAFDRSEHVYRNDALVELVKDAIRFFNGTPVHTLPPPETFSGTGVYAIYYTGSNPLYQKYAELNRLSYSAPIYVGKAVPTGWRQARASDNPLSRSRELYSRLREHCRSIIATSDLEVADFMCRFVIFESTGSDMIGTIEAALIRLNTPIWNRALDGFGNHDPGSGRYKQAMSDWDVLHPGRQWASRCDGTSRTRDQILANVKKHIDLIPPKQ